MDGDGSLDPASSCRCSPRSRRVAPTLASVAGDPVRAACGPGTPGPAISRAVVAAAAARQPLHDIAPMRVAHRQDLVGLGVEDRRFGYPVELLHVRRMPAGASPSRTSPTTRAPPAPAPRCRARCAAPFARRGTSRGCSREAPSPWSWRRLRSRSGQDDSDARWARNVPPRWRRPRCRHHRRPARGVRPRPLLPRPGRRSRRRRARRRAAQRHSRLGRSSPEGGGAGRAAGARAHRRCRVLRCRRGSGGHGHAAATRQRPPPGSGPPAGWSGPSSPGSGSRRQLVAP